MLVDLPAPAPLTWSAACAEDGPGIAELRALVLRDSLERLGRYDDGRVRRFFLAAFVPEHTRVLRGPNVLGCVALRPESDGTWLEHFYVHPTLQGKGVGSAVLTAIATVADASATTLRLNVLQRSDARRLYERHGFVLDHEDGVDVYLRRPPRP